MLVTTASTSTAISNRTKTAGPATGAGGAGGAGGAPTGPTKTAGPATGPTTGAGGAGGAPTGPTKTAGPATGPTTGAGGAGGAPTGAGGAASLLTLSLSSKAFLLSFLLGMVNVFRKSNRMLSEIKFQIVCLFVLVCRRSVFVRNVTRNLIFLISFFFSNVRLLRISSKEKKIFGKLTIQLSIVWKTHSFNGHVGESVCDMLE